LGISLATPKKPLIAPPNEKAAACEDQAGQAGTCDRAGDGFGRTDLNSTGSWGKWISTDGERYSGCLRITILTASRNRSEAEVC